MLLRFWREWSQQVCESTLCQNMKYVWWADWMEKMDKCEPRKQITMLCKNSHLVRSFWGTLRNYCTKLQNTPTHNRHILNVFQIYLRDIVKNKGHRKYAFLKSRGSGLCLWLNENQLCRPFWPILVFIMDKVKYRYNASKFRNKCCVAEYWISEQLFHISEN